MDVVAYGNSCHEEEAYFLVRAYKNREALELEQEKSLRLCRVERRPQIPTGG